MAVTLPRRSARDPEGRMPLRAHLAELRRRLFVSAVAVTLGAVAGWFAYEPVLIALVRPLEIYAENRDVQASLNFGQLGSAFDVQVKVSVFLGVLFASPVWLYQLWAFIMPGLTSRERRTALAFIAAGVPLFLAGVAMCWLVLPAAVGFLIGFTPSTDGVSNVIDAQLYLSTVMRLMLAFGIAFLLPVILVGLNLVGIVSGAAMLRQWRLAVFLIAVFAAVATPSADVQSMFALAGPMCALYFAAVAISLARDKRRDRSKPEWLAVDDDTASDL